MRGLKSVEQAVALYSTLIKGTYNLDLSNVTAVFKTEAMKLQLRRISQALCC